MKEKNKKEGSIPPAIDIYSKENIKDAIAGMTMLFIVGFLFGIGFAFLFLGVR